MLALNKHIKSILPNHWKYPLWYIFKSPQRKIGWYTLLTDLNGLWIYCFRSIIPKRKLEPVSICTGIYNRSENYLNQLLNSLNAADNKHLIELSVFDCESNDIENLEQKIRERWSGKLIFRKELVKFSRSYTFNRAVQQASNELIFICDADLSLPKSIVSRCNQFVSKNRVWYPIYFFLYKNKPSVVHAENGEWEQYGSRGMLACTKSDFILVGQLNESFKVWGGEDNELWERFHQHRFTVIRNREWGMFHHWHQTFNKKFMHMND